MGWKRTLEGKWWNGAEYGTNDAVDARDEALSAFSREFCGSRYSCLDMYEHDGETVEEKQPPHKHEWAVGLYCLGKCQGEYRDNIGIGLITDGSGKCGWFLPDEGEPYRRGLHPRRQFECKAIKSYEEGFISIT